MIIHDKPLVEQMATLRSNDILGILWVGRGRREDGRKQYMFMPVVTENPKHWGLEVRQVTIVLGQLEDGQEPTVVIEPPTSVLVSVVTAFYRPAKSGSVPRGVLDACEEAWLKLVG